MPPKKETECREKTGDSANDIDKCTLCGLCRVNCPTFKALRSEANSPRGKAILIKKSFDDEIFFRCTLCGACKVTCPINVDLGLKEQRKRLVERKIVPSGNRKMIENVRRFGNPFGDPEQDYRDDELYCC